MMCKVAEDGRALMVAILKSPPKRNLQAFMIPRICSQSFSDQTAGWIATRLINVNSCTLARQL